MTRTLALLALVLAAAPLSAQASVSAAPADSAAAAPVADSAAAVAPAAAGPARAPEILEAERLMVATRNAEAREVMTRFVAAHPQDAEGHLALARAYGREAKLKDAIAHIRQATELQPDTARYWMELATAYGALAGQGFILFRPFRTRKARGFLRRAVEAEPDRIEARMALYQYELFTPPLYGGSRKRAKEILAWVRERNDYHGGIGQALWHLTAEQRTQGRAELEKVMAAYPDSLAPYSMVGGLHREKKEWTEAFALLDRFRARHPDNLMLRFEYAATARLSGERVPEAIRMLTPYLSHEPGLNEPSLAAAHYELGKLYEKNEQDDQARAQYTAALKADTAFTPARTALRVLDRAAEKS